MSNTGLAKARWLGWSSGASGRGTTDNSFAQWRGSPVTIIGTWDDTSAEVQEKVASLESLTTWSGDVDIAIGGTAVNSEESYAEAARGMYVERWTSAAKKIQQYRGSSQGVTYVRPWHEFNGAWYRNWFVTPANVEEYKAAFRLMATTLRQNCPSCVVVWSPNNGSDPGAASIDAAYPGDDLVDVISVDSYNANGNPVVTDRASWDDYAGRVDGENPVGVEAWRRWAGNHGKAVAFSEWGLRHDGGGGDNPAYITYMNAWMSEHAAKPGDPDIAGKVLFDVYFNVEHENRSDFLIKDGPNAQAGMAYRSVRWGARQSPSPTVAAATSGATPPAAGATALPLPPLPLITQETVRPTTSSVAPRPVTTTGNSSGNTTPKPPAVWSSGSVSA